MQIVIPNWLNRVEFSKATRAKYWEAKDVEKMPKKHIVDKIKVISGKAYPVDISGNRFIKNPKKAGTPNTWRINGQDLYNAAMDWRKRKTMAQFYHDYFLKFIKEQAVPIKFTERMVGEYGLSISCDIYEVKQFPIPDVSNMWLLEKFFEDALVLAGIIPDDNPNYVIESGRKRYHWVETQEERKLIFNINTLKI